MDNLAMTYRALGRYADAVAMGERALEFFRRVLPENHPDIGEGYVWSDALHVVDYDSCLCSHGIVPNKFEPQAEWCAAACVGVRS